MEVVGVKDEEKEKGGEREEGEEGRGAKVEGRKVGRKGVMEERLRSENEETSKSAQGKTSQGSSLGVLSPGGAMGSIGSVGSSTSNSGAAATLEDALLRANILESKSGVCLFEKVWKWSGVAHAESVCKLILTFFQLSREMEAKDSIVSQVLFEYPAAAIRERGTSTDSAARFIGGSYKVKTTKKEKEQAIRLTCERNEQVIVAVFHESIGDAAAMRALASEFLCEFWKKYGKTVRKLAKTFQQVEEESSPVSSKEIMNKFRDFKIDEVKSNFIEQQQDQDSSKDEV